MLLTEEYTANSVTELTDGNVFTGSEYDSTSQQHVNYIGIKAFFAGGSKGAVVFNSSFLARDKTRDAQIIFPRFFSEQYFKTTQVLDITEQVAIKPNLNTITGYSNLHLDIPAGALVYFEKKVYLATQYQNSRIGSYLVCYADLTTGEIIDMSSDTLLQSCICLDWQIIARAGTPSQEKLYHYRYGEP